MPSRRMAHRCAPTRLVIGLSLGLLALVWLSPHVPVPSDLFIWWPGLTHPRVTVAVTWRIETEQVKVMMLYRPEIETAARDYGGHDPDLLEAIVMIESGGHYYAYRHEPVFYRSLIKRRPEYAGRHPEEVSASYGLMQIMYPTAVDLGFNGQPWDLFAPTESLKWGTRYLDECFKWAYRKGPDEPYEVIQASALASYNGGRWRNEPDDIPDRNAAYARKVLTKYEELKQAASKDGES